MKRIFTAITLLMASYSVSALELEYAGFYNYLKEANQVEYNLARPAFFLVSNGTDHSQCVTPNGLIKAGEKRYPLVMAPQTGEFFVPFDKRIKDIRGSLWFDLPESCQLKVAVVADLDGNRFSSAQVQQMATQIYGLMEEYAGMVKFLMPQWQKVVFRSKKGEQWALSKEQLLEKEIQLPWTAHSLRLEMAPKR